MERSLACDAPWVTRSRGASFVMKGGGRRGTRSLSPDARRYCLKYAEIRHPISTVPGVLVSVCCCLAQGWGGPEAQKVASVRRRRVK